MINKEIEKTIRPFCDYILEIANKPYEELNTIEKKILFNCYYILRKHKEKKNEK